MYFEPTFIEIYIGCTEAIGISCLILHGITHTNTHTYTNQKKTTHTQTNTSTAKHTHTERERERDRERSATKQDVPMLLDELFEVFECTTSKIQPTNSLSVGGY